MFWLAGIRPGVRTLDPPTHQERTRTPVQTPRMSCWHNQAAAPLFTFYDNQLARQPNQQHSVEKKRVSREMNLCLIIVAEPFSWLVHWYISNNKAKKKILLIICSTAGQSRTRTYKENLGLNLLYAKILALSLVKKSHVTTLLSSDWLKFLE